MDQSSMQSQPNRDGVGYLLITVTTARGAIPLEGASVQIRDPQRDNADILFALTSDRDGKTPRIPLSAPSVTLSQSPSQSNSTLPYAFYTVEVMADGYHSLLFQNVAVFDGITSVQPAVMIPLPENGRTDSFSPNEGFTFTGEEPNL